MSARIWRYRGNFGHVAVPHYAHDYVEETWRQCVGRRQVMTKMLRVARRRARQHGGGTR